MEKRKTKNAAYQCQAGGETNKKLKMLRRITVLLSALLFLSVMLTACGNSEKTDAFTEDRMNGVTQNIAYGTNAEEECAQSISASGEMTTSEGTPSKLVKEETSRSQQKLVTTVTIDIESLAFQDDTAAIDTLIAKNGGYTESASICGSEEDIDRYANYTIRIPAAKLTAFLSGVSGIGNTINESKTVTDITLQYVDTESRIKALEVQRDSLMKLIEQAQSVDSILSATQALSEVNYQLENYASQMRVMDNQVNEATVHLSIVAVRRQTQKETGSIWQQIGTRLSDHLFDIKEGLKNGFICVVGALPLLLIWAVVLCILFFLLRTVIRRIQNKQKSRKKLNHLNQNGESDSTQTVKQTDETEDGEIRQPKQ